MNTLRAIAADPSSWFDRQRVRFLTLAMIGLALLGLAVSLVTADQGQTIFGPQLGADYAAFYLAGVALNSDYPERLYDLPQQHALYHALLPHAPADTTLPFVYAPPLALLARPLAWLPYPLSFAIWTVISMATFRLAIGVYWRLTPALSRLAQLEFTPTLMAATAFCPFMIETVLGGQCSSLALLWIALAMEGERLKRPVTAGAILGLCLYKPTLLLLILPMLLLTRRFKMLAGFMATAVVLAAVSWWTVGSEGLADYRQLLAHYAHIRQSYPDTFQHWKYVDLTIFVQRLLPHPPPLVWWSLAATAAGLVGWLAMLAWRVGIKHQQGISNDGMPLAWAAALAWTPVLSPHCAIYDTILVIPALLLTADHLVREARGKNWLQRPFAILVLLVYLVPWFTQPLAAATRVQVDTLVMIALAISITRLAARSAVVVNQHAAPVACC